MTDRMESTVFSPGTVIGDRYRLVTLVMKDADGDEFWIGRDTVLPREIAVTLLPGVSVDAPVVVNTLRVSRLQHLSLPQVTDVGSVPAPGGPTATYIVGPWVDGAALADIVTRGSVEPTVAAALTADVTDAVERAHRYGLAFGGLNPALVRITADGRARLSHVIAAPTATESDDIRGAGALLYLMLTGRWPLDPSLAPSLAPAPRQGPREMAASDVNPDAPQALSTLAERALHPEGRQGIDAIGAMTTLLSTGPHSPRGDLRAGQPATATDEPDMRRNRRRRSRAPIERGAPGPALVRERRIKLGIAGGMMTVLAVLIVIIAAALTKQFLASIADPIEQSDSQRLIATSEPTTTRTVGSSTTAIESSSAPGSSPSETSQAATPSAPIAVAGATVYDPQGTPPKDYEAYVDRAFDGDPGTYWLTWVYKQQFGPGGIKDGVGLIMTFKNAVTPTSVTVSTGTPGTAVQIRSADSDNPSLGSTTVLGSATLGKDPVDITLGQAPSSKYLIVWVDKLAPYQGDSAENQGQYQSSITEITVNGH